MYIIALSGCVSIESTSETIKAPEYSKSDVLMSQYKMLLRQNKSPSELMNFLFANLKDIQETSINNANIAVMRLIDLQKKNLVEHIETANDSEYKEIVDNYDKMEKHDITDPDKKNWIEKYRRLR